MTSENTVDVPQPTEKELNFRRLEEKYERQLAAEREEKERILQELSSLKPKVIDDDEDDDSDPYIDKKKFKKSLNRFEEKNDKKTQEQIRREVNNAIQQERRENWLKQNSDFADVMRHAEKLAMRDPELADAILNMPEGFERQKLVYKNIKLLGLHEEPRKAPSIQDKVDANRRSPFYQPSGVGSAPYSSTSDFSPSGQKSAYERMKQLQSTLRLG